MRGALPKPTILELDEYDINQRVIEALTTTCSHAILFSIANKQKDAVQIAGQLRISLSSVYKTLANLEKLSLGLVQVSLEEVKMRLQEKSILPDISILVIHI